MGSICHRLQKKASSFRMLGLYKNVALTGFVLLYSNTASFFTGKAQTWVVEISFYNMSLSCCSASFKTYRTWIKPDHGGAIVPCPIAHCSRFKGQDGDYSMCLTWSASFKILFSTLFKRQGKSCKIFYIKLNKGTFSDIGNYWRMCIFLVIWNNIAIMLGSKTP